MILKLIGQKLSGELPEQDSRLLDSLLQDNSFMRQCYEMVANVWNSTEENVMDSEEAFRKLWLRIDNGEHKNFLDE